MGISGYEAFIMTTTSPFLLANKSIRSYLVNNQRLIHLLSLAGIAAYLVVDPRDGRRELTMYEERGSDGLFVDVDPAESVTVTIAGREIAVDDRLP